jgi:iron complex transport system permease protein
MGPDFTIGVSPPGLLHLVKNGCMMQNNVTLKSVIRMCGLLSVVLAAVLGLSLITGSVEIGIWRGIKGILHLGQTGTDRLTPLETTIIFSLRLPRVIFAGIIGASLALAGTVFQALLRNPLADPYVLGVSGGSAVGAIIGIVIGASAIPGGAALMAFTGAMAAIFLVFGIAGREQMLPTQTLLLAGVIVNAFFSALIMFLVSLSSRNELHNVLFWLMGDLSLASGREIFLAGIAMLVISVFLYRDAKALNLLVMGEETAQQLGINVERTKKRLFFTASLLTAVAVSASGIIGFVGLLVPHMMRLMFGADHRLLLPVTALFGASFLIAADSVARTITAPTELPVGVITALCGAPFFIYLLRKKTIL